MSDFFRGKHFGSVIALELRGDTQTRERLMQRIAGGLGQDRKLFVHTFWHAWRAVNG